MFLQQTAERREKFFAFFKINMRPGSGNVNRNSLGSSGGNSGLGTASGARPGSGMRKPPGSARLRTG